MESTITALQNASTSTELKAALDAIPRNNNYYTAEVRNLILQQKKYLIVDAPTADAVALFLNDFSRDLFMGHLLRTTTIHALIIDKLAPKVSEGDPVENVGMTIFNITHQNKPAAELYSNRKSLSAILDCFPRATTAGSAHWIASSIHHICLYNPADANKILNDLPVVEAYSAIIPYATTDGAVLWISHSIDQILTNNEPAQKKFGTLDFFEKFRTMKKYTSGWTKALFDTTMGFLFRVINCAALLQSLRQASTSAELREAADATPREGAFFAEIHDALLQQKHLIVDTPTADSVVSLISESMHNLPTRDLARTARKRDFIIDVLAPKISAGKPIENLGATLSSITFYNKIGAQLYSNHKSLSAILDCFYRATTAGSASFIVNPIYHICANNPSAIKILNDLPVVDAYSAIIPYATTDDSVEWISNSIGELLKNNEPAQKLFGTPAFVEKFRSMKKYATSENAKSSFKKIIDLLDGQILKHQRALQKESGHRRQRE